jgi:uncharacterized phage protein (TIGR01671 family)
MNKEIKFKAWNTVTKTMLEWEEVQKIEGWWKHEDLLLRQFTGRLDIHGVEIYKWDIVKVNNEYVRFVEFQNGAFVTVTEATKSMEIGENLNKWMEIEVLGNIFQNSELLTK